MVRDEGLEPSPAASQSQPPPPMGSALRIYASNETNDPLIRTKDQTTPQKPKAAESKPWAAFARKRSNRLKLHVIPLRQGQSAKEPTTSAIRERIADAWLALAHAMRGCLKKIGRTHDSRALKIDERQRSRKSKSAHLPRFSIAQRVAQLDVSELHAALIVEVATRRIVDAVAATEAVLPLPSLPASSQALDSEQRIAGSNEATTLFDRTQEALGARFARSAPSQVGNRIPRSSVAIVIFPSTRMAHSANCCVPASERGGSGLLTIDHFPRVVSHLYCCGLEQSGKMA